jgi:predicted acetyltransferase
MAQIEIVNPVPVEEAGPWLRALLTTLLDPHDDQFAARLLRWERSWLPELTWGARAEGRWIATLATEQRQITIPAASGMTSEINVDALSGVTVSATHRRRGLLTRMMAQSLAAARDRGDGVAALIAAEWPIYGRFGYAPAARAADYTFFPRQRGVEIRPSGSGHVRLIEPAEVAEHAVAVFDADRRQRPGQLDRAAQWWSGQLGLDGFLPPTPTQNWVLREGPDGADGLVSWRVTRDFELDGRMGAIEVGELLAATADAYRDLWAYLAGIDAVDEITLTSRPVDEPARWLMGDGRGLRQRYAGDWLWLRLLDVPVALAARGYARPGRLVIDVVDPTLGGFGAGRVLLDADESGATCVTTGQSPDVRLDQRALASIYLGGHTLRELAYGGGVEELTSGSLARADAMFATGLAPWNATMF